MNDRISSTRKHDRNRAINSCDAAAMRNSLPDIAVGNALCNEPAMSAAASLGLAIDNPDKRPQSPRKVSHFLV